MAEAVNLAEKGIQADGAGEKFHMAVGESGYLAGEELAFVKTFSFFPSNPERFGRSTTSSLVLLFDAETGFPTCLMEGGWVTALKTGASTTTTAVHLARADSTVITIFGAGMLGRMHLRALGSRFGLQQAYVVDILTQVAEAYASELEPEVGFPIEPVLLGDRERAVRESDIVVTVTTGDQPLVEWENLCRPDGLPKRWHWM